MDIKQALTKLVARIDLTTEEMIAVISIAITFYESVRDRKSTRLNSSH